MEASAHFRPAEAGTRAKPAPAEADGSKTTAAAPAAIPLPVGFVIEDSKPDAPAVPAVPVAPAASPEKGSETSRPAAGTSERIAEVPQPGTRSLAPEAELAFTARLVAEPAAIAPSSQRAPELHLAMPHELRAPAAAAPLTSGKGTTAVEATLNEAPAAGSRLPLAELATKVAERSSPLPPAPVGNGSEAEGEASGSSAAAALEVARAGTDPVSTEGKNASGGGQEPRPDRRSTPRATVEKGDPRLEDFRPSQGSPTGEGIRTVQTEGSETRLPAPGAPAAARPAAAPRTDRAQEIASALDMAAPARATRSDSKGPALRELSVVVPGRTSAGGETAPKVEIRLVERTGEVQVAVRSGDERLNNTLREGLGQLVSQLDERGYRAETWHPGAVASATGSGDASPAPRGAAEPGREGGDPSQSGRGGSDTAGRDGNARRDQQQNQPEWLDAFERSLGRAQAPVRSEIP